MLNLSLQTEISDMGNKESKERQLFIGVILQLLNKRGIKVKANVQSFFTIVQKQCPWFPEEGTVDLDTWEKVGKQLKTYYTLHGPEKVPVDAFALCNMIKNVLDPRHEAVRQPRGEAIAVDGGGSPPSVQIIFSAIDKVKEGDCALPPEEGEGLQDAAARRPGEPPPPLCKPLKIYPPLSDLRRPLPPPLAPTWAQEFPTLPPKPPRALPKAKKDREVFF